MSLTQSAVLLLWKKKILVSTDVAGEEEKYNKKCQWWIARISRSVTLTYMSSHVFPEMENTYSAIGSIYFEKDPIMVPADDARGGKVQQKLSGYLPDILSSHAFIQYMGTITKEGKHIFCNRVNLVWRTTTDDARRGNVQQEISSRDIYVKSWSVKLGCLKQTNLWTKKAFFIFKHWIEAKINYQELCWRMRKSTVFRVRHFSPYMVCILKY